jgi:hypothetical protein
VLLGVLTLGEHVGLRDGAGMGLLLIAAVFSLRASSSRIPFEDRVTAVSRVRRKISRRPDSIASIEEP